jgi:WD40 repeat protein
VQVAEETPTLHHIAKVSLEQEICGASFWKNGADINVAILESDSSVTLWNAHGEQSATLLRPTKQGHGANCVHFCPNLNLIISGHESGVLLIRSSSTRLTQSIQAHGSRVVALSAALAANRLASASSDGTVCFWLLSDNSELSLSEAATSLDTFCGITALALSPDAALFAIGDDAGNVSVWDMRRRAVLWSHLAFGLCVTSLAFSPNGNALAGGSLDGTACLWASQNGFQLHGWNQPQRESSSNVAPLATGAITALAFAPNGRRLALGHRDGTVGIYDSWTERLLHKIYTSNEVRQLLFSEDGSLLAVASSRHVSLWRLIP